jgi:hypothetical protein
MHRHPFRASAFKSKKSFELIHTDLMGPVNEASCNRHKYIMVVVDDHTRYAWVYFLKKKSYAAERLREFFALAQRQFDALVKKVRSDRGGEFLSKELSLWFES